jgi:hypothetical protein
VAVISLIASSTILSAEESINRHPPAPAFWRDYNRRADMENRIAELKHDLGADDFCLREFFATEAAFRSILLLFNLLAEFQRASGLRTYRQPATLARKFSFAVHYSAALATAWSCICPLPGRVAATHPAARKHLSLWRSNFAEVESCTRNLSPKSINESL